MDISRLETPALIVEEKIFYQNMEAMKKLLEGSSLKLRPHYKSHKCSAIARMQIQNGAVGMTCAKLSEALDLADAGIEDILIANQIVDEKKIKRVADLAGDCHLTVCVDDAYNISQLGKAAKNSGTVIHCLIEYEIGMQRCGVTSHEDVLYLAKCIMEESNLEFDGIQAYAGHISHIEDVSERNRMTSENSSKIKKLVKLLEDNKIPVKTISGGSTGTAEIKAKEGLYTELQAGSYLFMDATYRNLNLPFKNSLFVLSTVLSCSPGLTVVDSGVKTCGVDQGMPDIPGLEYNEIAASEEHFQIHGKPSLRTNDRIKLIPGHCCSTINLHDRIYMTDNGKITDRIMVTARGFGK